MTGVCARSDAATKDEFSTSTPPARGSPERAEPEQSRHVDPSPLSWSNLRYVFDIKEDCNGKQGIHALSCIRRQRISHQIDRLSSDIGGKRRSTMLELSGYLTRFLVRQEYTANDEPRVNCGVGKRMS